MAKSSHPNQLEFIPGLTEDVGERKRKQRKKKPLPEEGLPPNLAKPVKVKVPDFSDPKRPKTCLEVDFPIVPINALSALEGNAGKPIYQMSKWWARRRSCVFRAMLIAAAMEAPPQKNPDGSPKLDEDGVPIPDETEAAKAVWDVYYANHQAAGNFKNLKVLDCFMGGGTTLVEGSRLGFEVSGVDLNPVAWFVTKNELAGTDPDEVEKLFDEIEAEVKPVIQPFYVTECPRGHKGRWFELAETGSPEDDRLMPNDFDPTGLPPDERKRFRYEGPEVIYTFWAKHGPCVKPGCGHRTPVFRSPVIAEKKLGVKYIALTCKDCKATFHAELGDARMAPGAEQVVLQTETPYTVLSQPFAKRLLDYAKGSGGEKHARVLELSDMVAEEPGLKCPQCGAFAGQLIRDVLSLHRGATRVGDMDKKHFNIQPPRNSTKPVSCTLLIHPDWLKGSPSSLDGMPLGGHHEASVEETARWYEERLKTLRLIEVRGRSPDVGEAPDDEGGASEPEEVSEDGQATEDGDGGSGLPTFVTLPDGEQIDTTRGTIPKQSHFTCGRCGHVQDLRHAMVQSGHGAPLAPYAIQGYCPESDREGFIYGGRFFSELRGPDIDRLVAAEKEWEQRKGADLEAFWPKEEIPHTYMTHHANFALPEQGYTHWWKMFNGRQLLALSLLFSRLERGGSERERQECMDQVLGALQQYLRNQNMFCIYDVGYDKLAPFLSNPNYAPKLLTLENSVFTSLGRGNLRSVRETVLEGLQWSKVPWDYYLENGSGGSNSEKLAIGDSATSQRYSLFCGSASDLGHLPNASFDMVVTDPPFGDNVFYSDLSNFFYVWLRLAYRKANGHFFGSEKTPQAQEVLASRLLPVSEANARYQSMLTACWIEAYRVMKNGGLMTFTFHHSEDEQWAVVLESLFSAGFYLEATYPIRSDETKGDNSSFGSRAIEYDIIHVCRKRLEEPAPVSWPKMRQWVKAELTRLRRLLDAYKARELTGADIRVILRGKALEFYSRHYGQVHTSKNEALSIRHALLGINQLLDEDTEGQGVRPPSIVQPVGYQYLRLFGHKSALSRDEVSKSLRGTGIVVREFSDRGWVDEKEKVVHRVAIPEQFGASRQRPRREMKTEIDQAHFLIGAAMPSSGINLEQELTRDTWMIRRSVEAVLDWYAQTSVEPEIKQAAELAGNILRRTLEQNRAKIKDEQGYLFDFMEDESL